MCNCDCETPDYDDESGEELYDDGVVVAKKAIKCCECRHLVNAGEKYRHIKGRWGGDWSTYRMCLSCSAVSDRLSKELDICHCLSGLYEELIDSEILFTLKDDDGRAIEDEQGKRTWLCEEHWLRVVSQNPFKCEVTEKCF
ncbi:hypothetical protein [Nostoc sp.]|uniref:hypothetical protein n=1 Tax=Nostoc sp. TaxID=1180 RepID=UPI002FF9C7B9